MANVFIIHGLEGYPEENWFPWLKKELEKLGHKVFVPQFPTPENQTLDNWLQVFEQYDNKLTKDSIVIGHSLGVPFLLSVIEEQSIKAAFLVSGFVGKIGNQFDESLKTFAQKSFNWRQIKNNCKRFYLFHSDNDPYIRIEKAEELAQNLDTEVILVKGAGHFNSTASYNNFDLLLKKIKDEL